MQKANGGMRTKFLSKHFNVAVVLAVLSSFDPSVPIHAAVANVGVVNFAYVPAVTNISVGDTVIWTWPVGSTSHNVVTTATPTPQGWTNENTLFSGPATFTNIFNFSGTFPYRCTLHNFTGQIIVITNSPPTLAITNPTSGTVFAVPASVTIRASATNGSGSVTNVQFRVGTTILTNDNLAPFAAITNNLAAGSYTLTAIASDNGGLTATNSVSISVVTPVSVALTNAAKFSGTNLQFKYLVNTGLSYVVQLSTNLASTNWLSLVTNVAVSNPVVFLDTHATNKTGFYRVGRMPNP
jgi:plastocyanin